MMHLPSDNSSTTDRDVCGLGRVNTMHLCTSQAAHIVDSGIKEVHLPSVRISAPRN